jgi:hypothetical protein
MARIKRITSSSIQTVNGSHLASVPMCTGTAFIASRSKCTSNFGTPWSFNYISSVDLDGVVFRHRDKFATVYARVKHLLEQNLQNRHSSVIHFIRK